jgi:hypothetical protein
MSASLPLTSTGQVAAPKNEAFPPFLIIPHVSGGIGKVQSERAGQAPFLKERLTVYEKPDARLHCHPWADGFYSEVLSEEFVEVRAEKSGDGYVLVAYHRKAGDTYFCPANDIHMITRMRPGTRTHMKCTGLKVGSPNWFNYTVVGIDEDPRIIGEVLAALEPSTTGDFAAYVEHFNGLGVKVSLTQQAPDPSFGKLVGAINAKPA